LRFLAAIARAKRFDCLAEGSTLLFLPVHLALPTSGIPHASLQELAIQALAQGIGMALLGLYCYSVAVTMGTIVLVMTGVFTVVLGARRHGNGMVESALLRRHG